MPNAKRNGSVYRRLRKTARESGPCWLCGKPIDLRIKYPDPMSAAADHVEALALGGHVHGPMRPSHKVCNERRGTGAKGKQSSPPVVGKTEPLHSTDW